MTSRTTRTRRVFSIVAAAALVGTGAFAVTPAFAADGGDITTNGGAARHDADRTQAIRDSIVGSKAKNVILLIGDGMGDSEITVARNYAKGAAGAFAGIDALPLTGSYTTYSVKPDGTPDYASESASTASAWSTGTKAVDGSLSVDVSKKPQSTLLELAKANGLKTGNVSTAEIEDATPAAQIAHISKRGCYGPVATTANCSSEALENGGLGSIAEQLLNVRPDVVLGGGAKTFAETAAAGPWAGKTLKEQAENRGFQYVTDVAGLDGVTAADATAPVLGLFSEGNFPVRWNGPVADNYTSETIPAAASCTDNPERLASGLSLGSLTDKAIDLLHNDKGFFLQVEGASIDKQDHAANACGQIGETVDLDEAVQVALDFAKKDKNTLVVVTADHAHTSQIVDGVGPGLTANLKTVEGQQMLVAYGTSVKGGSQQHTGSQVRIAGYGPGAANVVGLSDQTDLFFTSANSLALNRDLAALSKGAVYTGPKEVAPGQEFQATVTGLAADWQATGSLRSDPVDLGQTDVLNGAAAFAATAPTELGEHTVTVTGAQTGQVVTAKIRVTENPAPEPAPTSPTPAAAGIGGNGPDSLATTGTTVPVALAGIALALVAAGAYLALRRRRNSGSTAA